ncbi:MSF1-domain-containing protein [Calocera viscosa TUFC12733]|uniref:MSF1-domain-containing protein n=1 Tax=Calocera viscosa (strain TUFC12733) TaxID=1330018 RepID=A0A167R8J8_CALVF|nr:MSF1-domain-containing protein [Calocera viscosa TUFC12733]
MKFFRQTHVYDDPFPTVTLAFFLRYPNPYASHIASVDVIDRAFTERGTLVTTRLILKRGSLPRWAPKGILGPRTETWVIEESEVDPSIGETKVRTRNLDHVKIMKVVEYAHLRPHPDDPTRTLHETTATINSNFSRLLQHRIEKFGLNRFRQNVEKSRYGFSMVLRALRSHRLQVLDGAVGGVGPWDSMNDTWEPQAYSSASDDDAVEGDGELPSLWTSWRR